MDLPIRIETKSVSGNDGELYYNNKLQIPDLNRWHIEVQDHIWFGDDFSSRVSILGDIEFIYDETDLTISELIDNITGEMILCRFFVGKDRKDAYECNFVVISYNRIPLDNGFIETDLSLKSVGGMKSINGLTDSDGELSYKPEKKIKTITIEYWACPISEHSHRSEDQARRCIGRNKKKIPFYKKPFTEIDKNIILDVINGLPVSEAMTKYKLTSYGVTRSLDKLMKKINHANWDKMRNDLEPDVDDLHGITDLRNNKEYIENYINE